MSQEQDRSGFYFCRPISSAITQTDPLLFPERTDHDLTFLKNIQFTRQAGKILALAVEKSYRFQHNIIDCEHILLALLDDKQGVPAQVFSRLGLNPARIERSIEAKLQPGKDPLRSEIPLSIRAEHAIQFANDVAKQMHQQYVEPGHLLLGIMHERSDMIGELIGSLNIALEVMYARTLQLLRRD